MRTGPTAARRDPAEGSRQPRRDEHHRRVKEPACDLCKAAKSGYAQGRKSITAVTPPPQLPDELVEALLRVCRAVVLRRPAGQVRELARHALQVADVRGTQRQRERT